MEVINLKLTRGMVVKIILAIIALILIIFFTFKFSLFMADEPFIARIAVIAAIIFLSYEIIALLLKHGSISAPK